MISELIMNLLECEHDPAEREKVYRRIEKAGVDRRTADLMASHYYKKKQKKDLKKALFEKAEELGWSCREDEQGIEFEQWSPAGEDFIFFIHLNDDLVEAVKEYASDFDTEEHIMMWVEAKRNGSTSGIPSIRELVKDADEIQKMLEDLAIAFSEVRNEVLG